MWSNVLTLQEQRFDDGLGSWSAGASTIISRRSDVYHSTPSCLRLENSLPSVATVSASTGVNVIPYTVNGTASIEIFAHIYSTASRTASIQVDWYTDAAGISAPTTNLMTLTTKASQWTLAKMETTIGSAIRSAKMTVRVGSVAASAVGEYHYFDDVHIMRKGIGTNRFLGLTLKNIPEFIKAADREQSAPDNPLVRYLDAATDYGNDVLTDTVGFWYQPVAEGGDGTTASSSLVNPILAKSEWLDWLAQVYSARRPPDLNTGFTPWFLLDNGGNRPWSTDVGGVTNWVLYTSEGSTSMSWSDIETEAPAPFNMEQLFREFILTGASGIKAGTTAGIKAAVRAMMRLTAGKSLTDTTYAPAVTVERHVGGNIWSLRIRTNASESPDSGLLILAADLVKPAGTTISYLAL